MRSCFNLIALYLVNFAISLSFYNPRGFKEFERNKGKLSFDKETQYCQTSFKRYTTSRKKVKKRRTQYIYLSDNHHTNYLTKVCFNKEIRVSEHFSKGFSKYSLVIFWFSVCIDTSFLL